jgi:hypothetical protein
MMRRVFCSIRSRKIAPPTRAKTLRLFRFRSAAAENHAFFEWEIFSHIPSLLPVAWLDEIPLSNTRMVVLPCAWLAYLEI